MSATKYWMWLACLSRLRPKAKILALEYFGSAKELFFAGESELRAVTGLKAADVSAFCDKNMGFAMKAMAVCEQKNIKITALTDSGYPSRLRNIYDPPCVLFSIGRLPPLDDEPAIAIAGTRKASPYGTKTATQLGYEISKGGGLIVSGLAGGIDSAAAVGALRAKGKCVGVLGTAIDVVYPKFNKQLFEDVINSGAIISEYPPGTGYAPHHFPQRNRILSGLSLGVIIIEAPKRSGALITADFATEQGRDVFVVPGNVDAPNCQGSNELLRDCAKPVLSGWDVLGDYEGLFAGKIRRISESERRLPNGAEFRNVEPNIGAEAAVKSDKMQENRQSVHKKDIDKEKDLAYIDLEEQLKTLNEKQLKIVSAMDATSTYADIIIERTGFAAAEVMAELTMLQILGFVTAEGFNKYRLNIMTK